jgi:hypothetical protein
MFLHDIFEAPDFCGMTYTFLKGVGGLRANYEGVGRPAGEVGRSNMATQTRTNPGSWRDIENGTKSHRFCGLNIISFFLSFCRRSTGSSRRDGRGGAGRRVQKDTLSNQIKTKLS